MCSFHTRQTWELEAFPTINLHQWPYPRMWNDPWHVVMCCHRGHPVFRSSPAASSCSCRQAIVKFSWFKSWDLQMISSSIRTTGQMWWCDLSNNIGGHMFGREIQRFIADIILSTLHMPHPNSHFLHGVVSNPGSHLARKAVPDFDDFGDWTEKPGNWRISGDHTDHTISPFLGPGTKLGAGVVSRCFEPQVATVALTMSNVFQMWWQQYVGFKVEFTLVPMSGFVFRSVPH